MSENRIITAAEHVAIIMDGNGRWAMARGKPRLYGHRAGAKRVRQIVEACPRLGVKYLTVFAFSTENWKRTQTEVAGLMRLFKAYILSEAKRLVDAGVRVRFIGDRLRLEPRLVRLMDELEEMTSENTLVNLTVAVNYGGRDEVARASRRMAQDVAKVNLIQTKLMNKLWLVILILMYFQIPILLLELQEKQEYPIFYYGNQRMQNTNLLKLCGQILLFKIFKKFYPLSTRGNVVLEDRWYLDINTMD